MRHIFSVTVPALVLFLACVPYAAAAGGRWQQTTNGCHVWDALPQPSETIRWSGDFADGKASGRGTEVFRYRSDAVWKEERYVGEMQGGKLNSEGTLVYDNGDRYDGSFVDSRRVGRAIYIHANGDRYEGDFKDDRRTGNGMFAYHNGGRYEGDFVNGVYEGHGTFIFANGDRYEGAFRGGLPNGSGTFNSSSGETVSGNWSNGCFRQGERVAAVGIIKEKCGFK